VTEDENGEAIEGAPDEQEPETAPERGLPPIDEDVTGQVNAAVPPRDDDK
jgi:hypothetical protein